MSTSAISAEMVAGQLAIGVTKQANELFGDAELKLIQSTAQAGSKLATPPADNSPPPAPVQVLPKEGSSLEVVA